jgi:hypothetical protein
MKAAKILGRAGAMLLLSKVVVSAPAFAQADPQKLGPPAPPKIVQDCRKTGTDEIIVCGRNERSPYRLPVAPPGFDPNGDEDSLSRERNALLEPGDGGIGSCSTVGPGGGSGCMAGRWRREREQHGGHGSKRGVIAKVRGRDDPEPIPPR